MKPLPRAPKIIRDESGDEYFLTDVTKKSPSDILLHYSPKNQSYSFMIKPSMVETNFFRDKPSPKQNPILQGKYECAPAALAMALGEKLFTVKRQMGKLLWRNDDAGVSDKLMRATARALGRDLIEIPMGQVDDNIGPCILTVKSLNVLGYTHAITWNGKELLDPNTHYQGRFYWGSDWGPDMIEAKYCHLLLDRPLSDKEDKEYTRMVEERENQRINLIKQEVLKVLQQSNSNS